MKSALALILLAACGSSNSGTTDAPKAPNDGKLVDAAHVIDAPADAQVFNDAPVTAPAMIHVSGKTMLQGIFDTSPQSGILVGFYKTTNEITPLATGTSDGSGNYAFDVPTGGFELGGFVKGTYSGSVDHYIYPESPLVADFQTDVLMVPTALFSGLNAVAGQNNTTGFVAVGVVDSAAASVEGATIVSDPAAAYVYDNAKGTPTRGTTATAADGVGSFVNIPPGTVAITAVKAGLTFKSHKVKARVGVLTSSTISAN